MSAVSPIITRARQAVAKWREPKDRYGLNAAQRERMELLLRSGKDGYEQAMYLAVLGYHWRYSKFDRFCADLGFSPNGQIVQ